MNKDNIPSEVPEAFREKNKSKSIAYDDYSDGRNDGITEGYNECLKATRANEMRLALIEAKDAIEFMQTLFDTPKATGIVALDIIDKALPKSEKEGSGE